VANKNERILRIMPISNPPNRGQKGRGPLAVLRRAKNVKNANDVERNALLEDAERMETWCANLVLGAIVLEAVVWISPLCPFLFKLGNFVADAAVAIGIYGEVRFGHVAGDILKMRLAEAIERAANAELETERLKAQFAWRSISSEIGQKVVSALSAYNGAATIEYISNDPEAAPLYSLVENWQKFDRGSWSDRLAPQCAGVLLNTIRSRAHARVRRRGQAITRRENRGLECVQVQHPCDDLN
jgi:hypothetical protein